MLRLNPAVDPAPFAKLYARDKCVQIPNIFEPKAADDLERSLLSLPWRLVMQDDAEKNFLMTPDELAALSDQDRDKLELGIVDRARRGIGYTYLTYPMIFAILNRWDPGHPIHEVTEFLNSPAFMTFAREIISFPGVTKVDAHAANYGPGHYLTHHCDDGEIKERRAAYTIGMSRRWMTDWGGLLLFIDDAGNVRKGFLPRFNLLTVFDGTQLHAVSSISHFAPAPRLTITGWFRDDPPHVAAAQSNFR